jgi:hypothetical protein
MDRNVVSGTRFVKSLEAAYERLGWASLGAALGAVRDGFAGADDGYNLSCSFWGGQILVTYGQYKPRGLTGMNGYMFEAVGEGLEELSLVPCLVLNGSCGYGSRIEGFFLNPSTWAWKVASCGGHFVSAAPLGSGIEFVTDEEPSERSWGDIEVPQESLRAERRASLEARLR